MSNIPSSTFWNGKKFAQRLLIDGVFLFLELVLVIAPVPNLDSGRSGSFGVRSFHLLQLAATSAANFGSIPADQIVDVFFRAGAGLGHFDFGLKIVPRFVAEAERDLVAQGQHLV